MNCNRLYYSTRYDTVLFALPMPGDVISEIRAGTTIVLLAQLAPDTAFRKARYLVLIDSTIGYMYFAENDLKEI